MKLSLSKALLGVWGIWALLGLICLGLAVHAVAINQYKDPLTFIAGIFYEIFALIFVILSRCKTATQPDSRNRIIAGILWVVAVFFAFWGGLGLLNIAVANL
jgi:hypothetical protein